MSNVAVDLLPSLTQFFSHIPSQDHLSMGGDTHNEPGPSPSIFPINLQSRKRSSCGHPNRFLGVPLAPGFFLTLPHPHFQSSLPVISSSIHPPFSPSCAYHPPSPSPPTISLLFLLHRAIHLLPIHWALLVASLPLCVCRLWHGYPFHLISTQK